MMQDYEIINADCLSAMQEMTDGCIDAIVTDPPYGLAFMGAKWDTFGRDKQYGNDSMEVRSKKALDYATANKGAPRYGNGHGPGKLTAAEALAFQNAMTPIFKEAIRVAKPGAHLLCFGGTRTFHRMTCAIEDAGWEIRDCIMWVYGSGFPKSMDVGKAIDKALGAKREKVRVPADKVRNPKSINSGHGIEGGDRPWMKKAMEVGYHEMDGNTPTTDQAKEWDGWGTCLKPAWEPIIVARKPLDGTVAHNVMEHGTGAINIDGCRIPTSDNLNGGTYSKNAIEYDATSFAPKNGIGEFVQPSGRFPANLVHDGSQEVLELFPDTGRSSGGGGIKTPGRNGIYGTFNGHEYPQQLGLGDSGSAARFFYCAKASKRDRGEGNNHPTVKPNALMRWLVRLVCPQGGTVLDPFMGSGSTGVACIQEGMRFVGIDMDEHYCEIANTRISKEADTVFCENQ